MSVRDQNIESLAIVARGLAELADDVSFVGGATIALYIDDPGAGDATIHERAQRVKNIVAAFAKPHSHP